MKNDTIDRPVTDAAPRWPAGFELVFEHAPMGIALLDAEGHVELANGTLAALLGYTQAEMRRFGMQAIVHDDDVEAERASRAAFGTDRARVADQLEMRLRHKRGHIVWGAVTRTVVRGPGGEPRQFIDQLQDLTEQRRAEKEIVLLNNLLERRIQRRTRELEESNQDLREFAYSIAHDLRGPLASIDGFSARLAETLGDKLDERNAHYLRRVRAGVRTMSELTDGLLALADISRADLARSRVDLSELAASILDRLAAQQPQRKVAVRVQPTPPVQGDPRLLANVMENLLGNAWKFTSRTDDAHIAFGVEEDSGGLRFFVSDNGAGFDPEYADKLFVPFQRLHKANEFEGTGIGLALVRKIVARHGGQVWAESRPDEGATFYFTIGS